MKRPETENENRGTPTVGLKDERVILSDSRYLIFFDFEITWPKHDGPAGTLEGEGIQIV